MEACSELLLSETRTWIEFEPLCTCSCSSVTECESVCPMLSEAKQHQNVRGWSRDMFIEGPARRRVAHALKNRKLLESCQQNPFLGKVQEGHGYLWQTSCCQILCS